jgi:exosortase A
MAVAAALGAFHDTATAIVSTWYHSSSFNHAFLIIPICLYLAWRRRAEAALVDLTPSIWGIAAVVIASLAWLVGRVTGTLVVQEIAFVGLLQAMILALCGWPFCRVMAFPLLYLFLAVPMGEALVPPLQAQTARMAVAMLQIAGVPVFADGNVISIPTGTFQVAEECSGIRYLIASLALGILFAGLAYRSWWRRAAFLLLSIVVPVLANGLRAFAIVFLAYLAGELALGIDHIIYGWVFFTAVSFVTLGLGIAMQERRGQTVPEPWRPLKIPRAPSPVRLLAYGVLAIAPAFAAHGYGERIDRFALEGPIRLRAPTAAEPWHEAEQAQDPLAPLFAAPDAALDTAYEANGARVYLHIGYYVRERRGAEVASSDQKLMPAKQWPVIASGERSALLQDKPITVQFIHATSGAQTRSIWYWYWVDGRFTGNPYFAKLLQAKAKLIGGTQAAAIIEAAVDSDRGAEDAETALVDFLARLRDLAPSLRVRTVPPAQTGHASRISDSLSQRG